jgi:hypothetical protein
VVPSIFRDLGSFFRKQKGQRVAKRTKMNLFAVFATFCLFCFLNKKRYHKSDAVSSF